jgi:phosphoglycolate phosphatase-like HAD superfamily hydrolase
MAALQVDTPIQLVLFDMAGTTVDDIVDGKPVVMVAMQAAFRELRGEDVPDASVTAIRGLETKEALRVLLVEQLGAEAPEPSTKAIDELYAAFKLELDKCLPRINQELHDASVTFSALQRVGIKVCVGSGFPQKTVDTIVETLGWRGM